MALMMENPVRSPMVPPMVESLVSKFAFSSFVILAKVGDTKLIFTRWSFVFFLEPEDLCINIDFRTLFYLLMK